MAESIDIPGAQTKETNPLAVGDGEGRTSGWEARHRRRRHKGKHYVTGVFVNYRTGDGEWPAHMIYKELAARFGADRVFFASESIPPGANFVAEIEQNVLASDVVLAVVGKHWLAGPPGNRRIDDQNDWVRRELRLAFENDIRVVPVLVDETPRLTDAELPPDIEKLRYAQHLRVRHRHPRDIIELVNELTYLLPTRPGEPWRLCLRDVHGRVLGAGVALGAKHVLTCAHHLPDGAKQVTVEFVGLPDRPVGRARVVREWCLRSRDVALLELRQPTRPGTGATLRRMALSWHPSVRVCGFPRGHESGVGVRALLAGDDGTGGWLPMTLRDGQQPIREGFGGAGVVDERTGDVLGVVVGEASSHTPAQAWMLPVETILHHLPRVAEWVTGDAGTDRVFYERGDTGEVSGDQVRITSEWVSRRDGGDRLSVVAPEEATAAVQVVRESTPDGSAVSGVDLAIDVTNLSVDDVARRLLDRSGTPLNHAIRPSEQLEAGVPPMTIVGVGIDDAQDPHALLVNVFLPLLRQGSRLLLAIPDGSPNLAIVREWRVSTLADRLRELDEQAEAIENIERELVSLRQRVRCHGRIDYHASVLRVALALARDAAGSDAEDLAFEVLDRTDHKAATVLREASASRDRLEKDVAELKALRAELTAYQAKANDDGLTEDEELDAAYRVAYERLWQSPVDLAEAREAVRHHRKVLRERVRGGRS